MPKLYEYQKTGVKFLIHTGGRAIIADDMGLGKTIQALAYINLTQKHALIICPANLKINWQREALSWTQGYIIHVCNGKYPTEFPEPEKHDPKKHMYIINYDILDYWLGELPKQIELVVLDECHYIKNRKAQRSKLVSKYSKHKAHIIGLSGTPILNRPLDFFPILNILHPKTYPSAAKFDTQFCQRKTQLQDLHAHIRNFVIRRTKTEVLSQLPKKQRQILPIRITNKADYDKLEDLLSIPVSGPVHTAQEQLHVFNKLRELRACASEGKKQAILEFLQNFLYNNTNDKIIAAGVSYAFLDLVKTAFPAQTVEYSGRLTPKQKEETLVTFQKNPNAKIFVCTIQSAGIGLNIVAANYVLFGELTWSPELHFQAEDRCHRIGQNKPVFVYYCLGIETIDEDIWSVLNHKRTVSTAILHGESDNTLSLLLKETKKRYNRK